MTIFVILNTSYTQLNSVVHLKFVSIHDRLQELEDQLQGLEATKLPAAPELRFKVCYKSLHRINMQVCSLLATINRFL